MVAVAHANGGRPASPMPSRSEMLRWLYDLAPDLRIQRKHDQSGTRVFFSYRGQLVEIINRGDDNFDLAITDAYKWLRQATGYPVDQPRTRELEQQIVAARFRGDHAAADVFELELVQLNAGGAPVRRRPAPARNDHGIRAPFGQRQAW